MQINFKHLRYFWAVAHEGNLTRAAGRLNVSQSALSTQIQKLEDQLGHKLFEREGRKLRLTEAGHIALDHADGVFALGEELVASLRGSSSNQRRSVRIGATLNLSRNFQLEFLRPILGKPDIHLVVHSGRLRDLLVGIETHDLDIVLTNTLPQRDTNTAWFPKLIDEQPVSIVGPPGDKRKGQSLADLVTDNPIIMPALGGGIRSDFDDMMEAINVVPQTVIEADDMAMLRLLARSGAGLAIVPPIVVRDELETGQLVEIAPVPGLVERFYAITRSRRFPNPIVRTLIKNLGVKRQPAQEVTAS